MDILTLSVATYIAILCTFIGLMLYRKMSTIDTIITESIYEFIQEAQKNEGLQKDLYMMGSLLGAGIAQGTGLKRGGSRGGWKDMVAEIAIAYIQGKGLIPSGGEQKQPLNMPTNKESQM